MTTTKSNLETQVQELTDDLNTERAKVQQFGSILGQLRYRVAEVLELDNATRSKLLNEIDTVFMRAL
jgi:hypothetical protein